MAEILNQMPWIAMAMVWLRFSAAIVVATNHELLAGLTLRMRIGAAFVFAAMLVPLVPQPSVTATFFVDFVAIALSEILCGALFGFGVQLWLIGADLCSQLFGQASGLGMMVFARGAASQAPLTRFLQLVWISALLIVGGHRMAIECLLETFQSVPVGSLVFNPQSFQSTIEVLATGFALGLQAGMPIVATLLLTMMVALLLGRMIPQIHVMATSTGLGALMLVAAMWVGCGPLLRTLEHQVPEFLSVLSKSF